MSTSKARQELDELPLVELRKLLALRSNLPDIEKLLLKRDEHLTQAKQIGEQIAYKVSGEFKERRSEYSVREMCVMVLKKHKKGLTPKEVRRKILKLFPNHEIKNLYNATFVALSSSSDFKKLKSGKFVLKR